MVACQRAFVRLASRPELSVVVMVVLSLLFLPAAGGYYWSSMTETALGARCLSMGDSALKPGDNFGRNKRQAIRLASRSELFGCSFDGFGLLFLPATRVEVSTVNYWSSTARFWWKREADAYMVHIGASFFYAAGGELGTSGRIPIRLASRQVCPVCCLSVMSHHSKYSGELLFWGALFLPAWEAGSTARYWGITAARPSSEGFDRAYQLDVRGAVNVTPDGYKIRFSRYCVRLASRENCQL